MAGLEAARVRGRTGGRPRRDSASGRVALAKRLYRDPTISIPEILKTLNISKATFYRWVEDVDESR
jgi:DNA invertase Pin-like site-specific DNA recombinase